MTSFFSEKYWRYRRRREGPTIQQDRACTSCGYNLRGLPVGRACPECGGVSAAPVGASGLSGLSGMRAHGRKPLVDVLTTSTGEQRDRWKTGLLVATLSLGAAMIAPMAYFLCDLSSFTTGPLIVYLVVGGATSIVWVTAAVMILPAILDSNFPELRAFRVVALWTQPLWMVGYALWAMAEFAAQTGTPNLALAATNVLARGVAGVGAIFAFIVMKRIAEDAELELQAERFNLAIWLLPIIAPLALLVRATFPSTIGPISFTPAGLVVFFFVVPPFLMLLAWAWAMSLVVRSVWDMRQHLEWAEHHAIEAQVRNERITEKRRQMDEELSRTIRPLPDGEEGTD